jgi:hypothetical protein
MPDPKLKTAMEEIKVILRKHDIGAVVMLASPTHTEYLYELGPTWACVQVQGDQIRVRAHHSDFPSTAAQRQAVTDTASLFLGLRDASELAVDNLSRIVAMLAPHLDITHFSRHEAPEG